MRNTLVLPLDENRAVTVKELRVGDVRKLLGKFKELQALPLQTLLVDHFADINALAKDMLDLPEGGSLDDLSGSEVMQIVAGIMEVNAAFLSLAQPQGAALGGLAMLAETSTAPASS